MEIEKPIILVTGSEGFVGTHLVQHLTPEYVVRRYDLKRGQNILNINQLKRSLKECDAVVHLAAYISVQESIQQPKKYLQNNVNGTKIVVNLAQKLGVKKFIFASSCAAREPDSSPYAHSKFEGEKILEKELGDMNSMALRFFNIYGRGQNPAYSGVIDCFQRGIHEGKITIYGDGEQTRDYIAVEDICRAVEYGLKKTDRDFQRYDIGTGQATTVNQLAEMMMQILGKRAEVVYGPSVQEMRNAVASTHKAQERLKFQAHISLEAGLEQLFKRSI